MARIFTSFAMEDRVLRDFLIGQKTNTLSSIEFIDYSVKEPWSSSWKTNCRRRIKSCSGMIGIITRNTPRADGQLWELRCAIDEKISMMLIHGHSDTVHRLTVAEFPPVIKHHRVNPWREATVVQFLNRLG